MAVKTAPQSHEQASDPSSLVIRFGPDEPLKLEAGIDLAPFQIAYQTYGELNDAHSNAVLVCHALTGDQHVANTHPVTGKPGWWDALIGPGKIVDTNRFLSSARTSLAGAWDLPAPLRPTRRPVARTVWIFRLSPSATWCVRKPW